MRKFIFITIITLIVSGCATYQSPAPWPTEIPEKSYFIQSYAAYAPEKQSRLQIQAHLKWIKRFYFGTLIYPTGWNSMTSQVIDSLETEHDKRLAKKRLFQLGKKISIEWAKDNRDRKINSSNIGVWGNTLKVAAEQSEQLTFIDIVENDVQALLSGELKSDEISNQRYYPVDDHDNF